MHGLKAHTIARMERLYRRRVPVEKIVTPELAHECADLTHETRRQIGLLINRPGQIESVIIGDHHELVIPNLSRSRSGLRLLRGVRLVHTHLNNQPLTQDDLTDLALLRLDLMVALGVGKDGEVQDIFLAHILAQPIQGKPYLQWKPCRFQSFQIQCQEFIQSLEQDILRSVPALREGPKGGQALLVSVGTRRGDDHHDRLEELQELVRACDFEIVGSMTQTQGLLHPKYVVGSGKMRELAIHALQSGADTLVFDQDLSPAQVRGISEITDLRVVDRTQVILEIFSKRAHSRIGKIQVELAQHRYRLPRLAQSNPAFSRLAGGIGTRGPGETKLESDRRRIRDRIQRLERDLKNVAQGRQEQRKLRLKRGLPVISLIGYTNAGKSTLLNALTASEVSVNNRVFETLDAVSRRWYLPGFGEVILTDTVGFIRDLPKDLMTAFQTTLEELREADILIHVIDGHTPDPSRQIASVDAILRLLELDEIPRLHFFNKADEADPEKMGYLCLRYAGIEGSAIHESTLQLLKHQLLRMLRGLHRESVPSKADENFLPAISTIEVAGTC